jgi:exopolysaccharide biosynthesis polyprenyl glycosylphosphotransferase
MPSPQRQLLLYIYSLVDLCLLTFALYVSILWTAAFMPLSVVAHRRIRVHTILGIAVLLILWRISLSLLGLYKSKRMAPRLHEITDLLKALGITTLLFFLIGLIFNIRTITPVVLARYAAIAIILLVSSRVVLRQGLKIVRLHGHNLRHILVVGTNARAIAFANGVVARPELGYRLVGFADNAWVGPTVAENAAGGLVSDLRGFRSYLRDHVIDEVMIALPIKSFYDEADELLRLCQEQGIIVRVLTDLFERSSSSTEVTELGSEPVVSFYKVPADGLELGMKRFLDIVGASLMLILLSPLLLIAWIVVKADSDGPALFVQERVGLNKRRFRMYKFRSMVRNAEALQGQLESCNEAKGPVFKIKQDPRITRFGKIIRKTSIDELPQLFNVLRGDMSLVGPRPLPVRDYTGFSEDWQRRRFSVRPGITCLWQISGRSSISFTQWMDLDLKYIDQWSLWLDLKILAQTIPAVVRGSGSV